VVRLLERCSETQYRERPHEFDPGTAVHTFVPRFGGERWYVNAYFLAEGAVFISVHVAAD
jgi:hypothetical protein